MAIGVVTETGVRVNQLRNEHLNMIKATVCYAYKGQNSKHEPLWHVIL